MPAPIAVQLYSVRAEMEADMEGTLRAVADMGYVGVETAGVPGGDPAAFAARIRDLGMEIASAHIGLDEAESKDTLEAFADGMGCTDLAAAYFFGEKNFGSLDAIKATCAEMNRVGALCGELDLRFSIHNHWWEFEELDGRNIHDILLELLDPCVLFELDVYWAQTAGVDPVAIVRNLGARAPLLHIKDGTAAQKAPPHLAVGQGVMDIPAIIEAGAGHTEWQIVELDACDTDMVEAVRESQRYLTENGLARGR